MHSFLLIGNDEKTIQEKVALLCKQQQVKVIDQKIFTPEKAIGIEDIRLLQEKLSLAPLQSTTKTLIVNNADTMSIAAQNALLKTLEEPPNNTLIILTATSKDAFLPTVHSRCTLITDSYTLVTIDKKEYDSYITFFASLPEYTVAQQMVFAQNIGKTKDTAVNWLKKGIQVSRDLLLETKSMVWAIRIRKMQRTYTLLFKTNSNPRLAMEHLFIDLL
jgi:hypothetical protein